MLFYIPLIFMHFHLYLIFGDFSRNVLFLSSFIGPWAHLSLDKVCHFYICLFFFLFRQVCRSLCVSTCALLVSGGAGSDQKELLCAENFRRLSAETVNDPFKGIFHVRKVVCSSNTR